MFLESEKLFSFFLFSEEIIISNIMFMSFCYFIFSIIFIILYRKNRYINFIINDLYNQINQIGKNNIGNTSWGLVLFFIFWVISTVNILGCFSFPAFNSSPIFPFFLSFIILITGLMAGIRKRGLLFFWKLVPTKVPILLKPLLLIIKTLTFFSKPIILGARLLLNVAAGHMVLQALKLVAISFGWLGYFFVPVLIIVNCLELFIGLLQAYLFVIFSSLLIENCVGEDHQLWI